ncbi:MAG TPA: hypothetical protein VKS01_05045 [Bryobacteraceae bacterium]|nr:hypothetical protein [Bryobacteraceae bacterium]
MTSRFLLPESVARRDGDGAVIALEAARGKSLLLTLEINRSLESESLEVSVWGSPDQRNWKPLDSFPPKNYCGTYALTLDLRRRPEIAFLRAAWKMSRWSRSGEPLFGFHLFAEEYLMQTAGAA